MRKARVCKAKWGLLPELGARTPKRWSKHQGKLVCTMNELEQLVREVRGFATEVRKLGYSSVAGGHENQFLELSERMIRYADEASERSLARI